MNGFNNYFDYFDLPIDQGYRTYAPATKGDLRRLQTLVITDFNQLVDGFNTNVDFINENITAVNSLTATGSNMINSASNLLSSFNSDYATPSVISSTASNALANAIYAYSNATSAASVANSASANISAYDLVLSEYGTVVSNTNSNASIANQNASNASNNASQALQQVSNNTSKVNGLYLAYNTASNAVKQFNQSNTQSVINSLANASEFYSSLAQSASDSYTNAVYQSVLAFNSNTALSAANITQATFQASAQYSSLFTLFSSAENAINLINDSNFSSAASAANYLANGNLTSNMDSFNSAFSNFSYAYTLWFQNRDSYSVYLNSLQSKINNTSLEFSWSASANQSYTANFSSYAAQLSNDAVSISAFASAANDAYNNTQINNSLATQANSNANNALALAQSAQSNAGQGNSVAFDARTIAEKASSDASLASSAELVDSANISSNAKSIAYNDLNRQELPKIYQQPANYTYTIKLPDAQSNLQIVRTTSGRYSLILNPLNGESMESNGLLSYQGTSGDNLSTTSSLAVKPTTISSSLGYSYPTTVDLTILIHQSNRDRVYKINGICPMNPNYSTISNNSNSYSAWFTVQRLN